MLIFACCRASIRQNFRALFPYSCLTTLSLFESLKTRWKDFVLLGSNHVLECRCTCSRPNAGLCWLVSLTSLHCSFRYKSFTKTETIKSLACFCQAHKPKGDGMTSAWNGGNDKSYHPHRKSWSPLKTENQPNDHA